MGQSHVRDVSVLPPGWKVGTYSIERVLGQGGFGITYLGRDTVPPGPSAPSLVALKEYFPEQFATRQADGSVRQKSRDSAALFAWGRKRFIEEARLLARFHHPTVVKVTRCFEAAGTAYIVMTYVPGQTLSAYLKTQPVPLPLEDIRGRLLPLLDGLALVHDAGILHRDIAPSNIMIGIDGAPVLIDFGSARQLLGLRSQQLTAIGKDGFAPLEQYSSTPLHHGPWSDLYAFAAVLYLCVVGHPPAKAHDRLLRDPFPSAVAAGGDRYPPAFLRAIDWGLAVDADHRPRSVGAWRRALGDEVLPQVQKTTGVTPPMPTAARWAIILGSALLLIVLLTLMAGAGERSAAPDAVSPRVDGGTAEVGGRG